MVAIPILTYHSANIAGNDYQTNDHVAFSEDLRVIDAAGLRIVPLTAIVDALLIGSSLPDNSVALTFDDGADFDFRDLEHPQHGMQRSMFNVMRDFMKEYGPQRQPGLSATSFVIASPAARKQLDGACFIGKGWMSDDWWPAAVASGLLFVGNHSWDHNHPAVEDAPSRTHVGTFRNVTLLEMADYQIRQARDYILERAPNPAVEFFAYPYGESNEYLREEYFARGRALTGTRAAFTTDPTPVTRVSSRWNLPRYVCGAHWRSTEDLLRVLMDR